MKIKLFNLAIHLICIGIFITPSIWRVELLNSQIGLVNFFSWIGIIALMFELKKYNIISSLMRILILVIMFVFSIMIFENIEILSMFKYIYATILPLIIVFIKLPKEKFIRFYLVFCNYLLLSSVIIVYCGILDFAFNFGIGNAIANITQIDSLVGMAATDRMISYVGHPLYSSQILIFCFSFNFLKYQYFIKTKNNFKILAITIVCFVGIALAGSKTGMVIIIVMFAMLFVNRQKIKIAIIAMAVGYFFWTIGIFDPVLERFAKGIASGDLSTGRNTSLLLLMSTGQLSFKFFGGYSNTNWSTQLIAALEYPILRWSYVFGIWFAIIISIWLFVMPVAKCIAKKQKNILVVLCFIILQVNSYNGITTIADHMLLYCISIMLLMNLVDKVKELDK